MSIITNAGLNSIVNLIDSSITHIGLGIGSAPAEASIVLDCEQQRKAATTTIDGNTIIKEGYWDESEANGVTYTNAGVFFDSATITPGTGTLFSGGGITIQKDSRQALTVSFEITIEAVNY